MYRSASARSSVSPRSRRKRVVGDPQHPARLGGGAAGEDPALEDDDRRATAARRGRRGHAGHAAADDDHVGDVVPLVAPAVARPGHGCSTQASSRSGTRRCSGMRSGPITLSIQAWTCQMRRSW